MDSLNYQRSWVSSGILISVAWLSGFIIHIRGLGIPRLPFIFGLGIPRIPYICGLGIPWIPSPLHPGYSMDSLNSQRSGVSSGILLSMASG